MKKIKNLTIMLALTFSTSIVASEFTCNIKINNEDVHNTSFEVSEGEKFMFADSSSLKFSLKAMKKEKYELEAFDLSIPSRSYATSMVKEKGDNLSYTLWTRDSLIEVKCELN